MKPTIVSPFWMFMVVWALGPSMAWAFKVGTVDVQKALLEVKEGQRVKAKLEAEFKKKKTILSKEESAIEKMKKEFDGQFPVLNAKARAKKEKELQNKIFEIQKKILDYQKDMREQENKLKAPIVEKIRKMVRTLSVQKGVDATFEASTAPVLYAKDEIDMTKELIEQYDKKYK